MREMNNTKTKKKTLTVQLNHSLNDAKLGPWNFLQDSEKATDPKQSVSMFVRKREYPSENIMFQHLEYCISS